jgi:hypothetical protein
MADYYSTRRFNLEIVKYLTRKELSVRTIGITTTVTEIIMHAAVIQVDSSDTMKRQAKRLCNLFTTLDIRK